MVRQLRDRQLQAAAATPSLNPQMGGSAVGAQAWIVGAHARFKEETWPLLDAAQERGERQRGARASFSNGFSPQSLTSVFQELNLSFSAF